MALQFSVSVRNARLDAIEVTIGTAPVLELRSGAPPANCAASATGTVLATLNLPSDFLNAASGGSKTIAGTWQDLSADAGGTVGYFRISQAGTCHVQGTVTNTGGGGDMTLDNVVLAIGQQVTITTFTLNEGNA